MRDDGTKPDGAGEDHADGPFFNGLAMEDQAVTARLMSAACHAADGRRTDLRLVGPDVCVGAPDYISDFAPRGRAVLGKTRGAEVNVPTPDGDRRFELTAIRYGQEAEAKKSPAEAGRITGGNRRATANEPN